MIGAVESCARPRAGNTWSYVLFRALWAALLVLAAVLSAQPVSAQTSAPPKATFCVESYMCFDTNEKALQYLRESDDYKGIGQYLTAYRKFLYSSTSGQIWTRYIVRDRPLESISAPAFSVNLGIYGVGNPPGCPASTIPEYANSNCGDEGTLVSVSLSILKDKLGKSCSLASNEITQDYRTTGLTIAQNGLMTYPSPRYYKSTFNCLNNYNEPVTRTHTWSIYKKIKVTCETNFKVRIVSPGITEAELPTFAGCQPRNTDSTWITSEFKQYKSCKTNNPCHPTSGDKSREERDFEFAGRPFNRYYHSINQQISVIPVGQGWSTSYSDFMDFDSLAYTNEAGEMDRFVKIDTTTYRAANSERVLKIINSGEVHSRVIESSGEYRDFTRAGVLLAIKDPASPERDVRIVREGARVARIVDARNRAVTFDFDQKGRVSGVGLPDGQVMLYDYDLDDNFVQVTYPDTQKKKYLYHEKNLADAKLVNHLTGIIGEGGKRYGTFAYDAYGRVISSKLHGGKETVDDVTLTYLSDGVTEVKKASGSVQRYEYTPSSPGLVSSSFNPIKSVSDSAGSTTSTYHPDGRLKSVTDASGRTNSYEYAPAYRSAIVGAVGTADERRIEEVRDPLFNQLTERKVFAGASLLLTTRWTRNARGQVETLAEVDAATGKTRQRTFAYCEQSDVAAGTCPLLGVLRRADGPRTDVNDITTLDYFPASQGGDLRKITNALGQTTEILAVDAAGRVLSQKDATGVTTDYTYDARGRVTAIKVRGTNNSAETDDRITQFSYYPTGLVKQILLPSGAATVFTYDPANRLTKVADKWNNAIVYTLDKSGNRVKEEIKDAKGVLKSTLSRVYDELGNLEVAADAGANPTDYEYDATGALTLQTDALNRKRSRDYDALHRLKTAIEDTAGIKAKSEFKYDAHDRLTEVTDPKGLKTTYKRNGLGELLEVKSPDTGATTLTYDAAGNVLTRKDARNKTVTYTYDALDRPLTRSFADASLKVTYAYDTAPSVCAADESFAKGRLASMQDGSGTTQYCYNRFGDLVRKVQSHNGVTLTLRYVYAANGNLASLIYPDNSKVDYTRDSLGRTTIVAVTRPSSSKQTLLNAGSYHPFGPIASWTYGNGRKMTRPLDLDYRPQAIQDSGADGLQAGLAYNEVGELTSITSSITTTPNLAVKYDALGRITEVKDPTSSTAFESYTYDATGNRTSVKRGAANASYVYPATSHRLTSAGGQARTYDAAGNTTALGGSTRQYTYDDAGRLSQAKTGSTVRMNYRYNGKGERVRAYLGDQNTYSLYDEAGHWLGDYGSTGAVIQQAVWMDDLPVGLSTPAQLYYIQPDHLGTPRAVIDPVANKAVWSWSLRGEAFGATAPNEDPDQDGKVFVFNMRFPGQRYDAASGLNYNYFRDYDPETGRYGQSDPIGLAGGLNTFAYVGASPYTSLDPLGLLQWSLMPVEWRTGTNTGDLTQTYPGASTSTFKENTLARTTMDWNISPRCVCVNGGYSLDEYSVSMNPVVLMRNRYASPSIRRGTRADEMDHVRDLNAWSNGARAGAEAFESGAKSGVYATEQECSEKAKASMQQHLVESILPAIKSSQQKWDLSGKHQIIVR